jgi:hypothetical protein
MRTQSVKFFVAIALSGTLVGACGPSPDRTARVVTDVPFGLDQTTTTSTTTPAPTTTNPEAELTNQISLYYVSTNRLVSVPYRIVVNVTTFPRQCKSNQVKDENSCT